MKRILVTLLLVAAFGVTAKAQDSLNLALANKELAAKQAELQSEVASLQIRLEMAQARIAELEKAAKPQSIVVTVQSDPSQVQVNREAAANLRAERALAIANAFKVQAPQVTLIPSQRVVAPALQCTSQQIGVTLQTVCQ